MKRWSDHVTPFRTLPLQTSSPFPSPQTQTSQTLLLPSHQQLHMGDVGKEQRVEEVAAERGEEDRGDTDKVMHRRERDFCY